MRDYSKLIKTKLIIQAFSRLQETTLKLTNIEPKQLLVNFFSNLNKIRSVLRVEKLYSQKTGAVRLNISRPCEYN